MKNIPLPSPNPEPGVITCRHCGSTQVRPSKKSTGSGPRVTYRCQACKQHFHVGASRPNRRYWFVAAAVIVLATIGLAAIQQRKNPAAVDYQPKVDLLNRTALAKVQQDAKQGDPQAQYDLGRTYWQNAEYPQAFPFIKAAADHGHIEAEYLLGMAYLYGRGTLQNYQAALAQFNEAAQHGHLEAQYRLGILHRDGLAMPPNKELAYLWLNIAAARGHEDALIFRDKLAAVMSTEELNRAQAASAQTHAKLSGSGPDKPVGPQKP